MKYKFKDYFLRKILIATKPKFNLVTKYQSNQDKIMILDIGVANSSVKEDKIVFPKAQITALDYLILDKSLADEFIHFDLDSNQPLPILSKYNIVIFNHVIEHINKWKLRIVEFCQILNVGGILFIEFPNINSLKRKSTYLNYHFHDDETHKTIISEHEICQILLDNNFKIIHCGSSLKIIKTINALLRLPFYIILRKSPSGLFSTTFDKITTIIAIKNH
jgi:hypothetical protein